jgi:hypothetical protein
MMVTGEAGTLARGPQCTVATAVFWGTRIADKRSGGALAAVRNLKVNEPGDVVTDWSPRHHRPMIATLNGGVPPVIVNPE